MKKIFIMATAALLMAGMASCVDKSASTTETAEAATEEVTTDTEIKDNKTLGREFLEQNAKNDSVVQTESGLQYMVLKEGNGAKPGPTDKVTVHYTGRLLDGTVFDSSVERGEPATFGLDQVIPGWTEGLQLMSEGSEYRLFIPSELAYGSKGAGDQILPNSTLIFDVKLIKVEKND
ncbi:MAG: FKBP-type peptidyl-prolyl cis-trans isomerase [Muribaculaceae bacterium]|nr:FKBP-type peptidyl-prolyl cis-trans isomerase [Muribaculaceae bacterium]